MSVNKLSKTELLKRIGSVEQIGGIKDFTFNDGKAKGVRAIEVNTGVIRFTILADRGMDIADAYFENTPVSWISKTGITSPAFYEKDGAGFLRGFYGGLVTTCGLKNLGGPYAGEGLHGRAANLPAEKVSVNAEWIGDDYVMEVSGTMRESVVFGCNLIWKRTIRTKLFADSFTLEDTVTNESFNKEDIALCYHCNFGYPLVSENSKIVGVPEEYADICAPVHGIDEECIDVPYDANEVRVGIENADIGAYITYSPRNLRDFLIWKMVGESEYVIGLEPRTSSKGGEELHKNNLLLGLEPFEKYSTKLLFEFKKL